MISLKMAGGPKHGLFFFFFPVWNYNSKGAGAMVGKGLQDPQVRWTCSGKRWGVWATVPPGLCL